MAHQATPLIGSSETAATTERSETPAITERLLTAGVWIAVVGATAGAVGYLTNALFFDERFYDLNAKLEGNVFTWASTVATFAAAFAAFLHAVVFPKWRTRFAVVSGVFAFFSLDDLIRIHERVGEKAQGSLGLSKNIADQFELAIFGPLFVTAFLIIRSIARPAPERVRRLLNVGLWLLVAAVVVEAVGVITRRREEETSLNWPNQLRVAIEEGMELAGWVLVATGLAAVVSLALVELGRSLRPRAAP